MKNAAPAMTTIPAASPSRPSRRFTAFTMRTTQATVRGTARSDPTTMTPWPKGNQKNSSSTPVRIRRPAAKTCPAILAGADRATMSSISPTAVMTRAARSVPWSSSPTRNADRRDGTSAATPMPAATPISSPTPPPVGVGLGCTFRSEGRSMVPSRTATRRTTGVTTATAAAETRNTPTYASIGYPRIDGEAAHQLSDRLPGALLDRPVLRLPEHVPDDAGDLLHLGLVHPDGGGSWGPDPDARRLGRRERVERDGVLVQGDPHLLTRRLGLGPGHPQRLEVDQREVGVRTAGHQAQALMRQARCQGPGRPDRPFGVVAEFGAHRLLEAHGLRRDGVLQRPSLHHREHRLVDGLGVLLAAQDHRAAGTPERLVGGEGDHVRVGNGTRVGAARDQPDEVRGVDHE